MTLSKYLINEQPRAVYPTVAKILGINEAHIIQQLHFLLVMTEKTRNTHNFIDGHYWVYNSYPEWQEDHFPWLAASTIKRLFLKLEELGIVVSKQGVKSARDRRKWYRIDYAVFEAYVHETSDASAQNDPIPSYQNEPMDGINLIPSSYSETTTETTTDIKDYLAENGKAPDAPISDPVQEPEAKIPKTQSPVLPGAPCPTAWDEMSLGEQHDAMKAAIVAALGWEVDKVVNWGEIDQVSKKLRKVGATMLDMAALGAYVRARHKDPRPAFLASDYPEFKKRQESPDLTPEQDALRLALLHGYKIDDPATQDPRINAIACWLAASTGSNGKHDVGQLSRAALPEHVKRFFAWYHQAYQDACAPMDFVKFSTQWRKFATSQKRKAVTVTAYEPEQVDVIDPDEAKRLIQQTRPDYMTEGVDHVNPTHAV